jgi:formyltetrahydrofolate hydrolase
MTIVEFYKKLSSLLTKKRENLISMSEAKQELRDLLSKAEKNEIQVEISNDILNQKNLMRLDDENSFKTDYESDDDYDSDYVSSY